MEVDAEERHRRARAILGYTFMDAKTFAKDNGIPLGTLRNWTGRTRSPPSIEDLVRLAQLAGVPSSFALNGFAPLAGANAEPDVDLAEQIAALQKRLADVEPLVYALATRRGGGNIRVESDAALRRLESLLRSREDERPPQTQGEADAQ